MPELLITCPNLACSQPLKLPSEAVGQPLSCPHCRSALRVELTPEGTLASVTLAAAGWRVPRQFFVPGLALLMVGLTAILMNGYLAWQCRADAAFALEYARNRAHDLRNGEELNFNSNEEKPDDDEKTKERKKRKREAKEATSDELFGALAGSAAAYSVPANADERTAQLWAPWIYPSRFVGMALGAISAVGGYCMLRGRGYLVAFAGCIAAAVNVNELACCVPGAIAGFWGILMLVRDDGRRYFRIVP
jgi:hypothetical protein